MIVQVFQYSGSRSRSVVTAILIEEVYVDEPPEDEFEFAEEHGGDFIEVIRDYEEGNG